MIARASLGAHRLHPPSCSPLNANQTEPNFFWEGTFQGHLTPAGASGGIRLDELSGTDLRFTGKWTTNGPFDPMDDETAYPLWVSGKVIGDIPT